jgi:phage host-nuclease inhibitor protein Gam
MSEAQKERFAIDTDLKAEWALKKIREARADRDRMLDWYKQKEKEITEQTDRDTAYFEGLLAEYFSTLPHKVTKTQESYSLPGGKLVLKKQNPEYKRDDAAVIAWLKENGGGRYVKVSESLDWASLKADTAAIDGVIVDGDGQIIPGIEVVERGAKFTVEV